MAERRENHQTAARHGLVKGLAPARRDQPVLSAPEDQRRDLDLGQALDRARRQLVHALHQRDPVAFAQRQFVVTVHQRGADAARIAIDVQHTGLDGTARQDPAHRLAQQRRAGDAKTDGQGFRHEGMAAGIDQHEAGDALRIGQGKLPGDLATERVAADNGPRHAQPHQQPAHEVDIAGVAVVALRVRAAEAGTRQVEADDAPRRAELRHPSLPGVQAGAGAMDQYQGQGITARALVAVVHQLAVQLEKVRRRWRPARHQALQRTIRRLADGKAQRCQHQQDAEGLEGDLAEAFHSAGLRSGASTSRSSNTKQWPW
mmetsp:Transcript_70430/g.165831  ORF Transcript_70430/g.165831 Transcript_70430/m.165831 type:complete len:316 (-) Transcript_70430:700-1647(-)